MWQIRHGGGLCGEYSVPGRHGEPEYIAGRPWRSWRPYDATYYGPPWSTAEPLISATPGRGCESRKRTHRPGACAALQLIVPGEIRIQDVPCARVAADEVLVRVAGVGPHSVFMAPHGPGWPFSVPMTMGHETALGSPLIGSAVHGVRRGRSRAGRPRVGMRVMPCSPRGAGDRPPSSTVAGLRCWCPGRSDGGDRGVHQRRPPATSRARAPTHQGRATRRCRT